MNSSSEQPRSLSRTLARAALLIALPAVVFLLSIPPAEPVFCGDSNRHMMTSVFFRDFLIDGQYTDPKGYAEHYYEQYPALGLMVWPPLFHGVCGTLMLVFGTSVLVGRGLVLACFIASVWFVHRIARRAVGDDRGVATAVLFSVTPIVFDYGRDVMLEVPTLALVLWSVDQFDLWLRLRRPRCLYAAAVAASCAALTRFDAVVLLPFYALLLTMRGAWSAVWSRHALTATAIAVCLTGPVYFVIAREAGDLHLRQATHSVGGSEDGTENRFLAAKNWTYYPSAVVEQCAWPMALLCIPGLLASLRRPQRHERDVLWALLIATYVSFSPLAELRARHAIYWVPAIAGFAVCGAELLIRLVCRQIDAASVVVTRLQRTMPLTPGLVDGLASESEARSTRQSRVQAGIAISAWSAVFAAASAASVSQPHYRVTGYSAAAQTVIAGTAPGASVFFDGWWDGNFTYHLRHLDASRSRSVIRGDQLLYEFVCVPDTDFHAHAATEVQILEALVKVKPDIVVIESPQFFREVEVAQRLRNLIAAEPAIFVPVKTIPVESSLTHLPKFQLEVYRFETSAARDQIARLIFSLPEEVLDDMEKRDVAE